jgi:RNA-directed DNA polymerase
MPAGPATMWCKHTDCAWALLYIERWLKAPAMLDNGELVARMQGTPPQGGVISPLLANLFLHYAFDIWLGRAMPGVPFERYADDIICHCRTEHQARILWERLERRFAECGLVLHPQKTKLVYCKDTNRNGEHGSVCFDFLGYTFRPRLAKWRGGSPAVGGLRLPSSRDRSSKRSQRHPKALFQ